MKNPLRYQMTEYDCGPTSMLNAVSYLFQREAIILFNDETVLTEDKTVEYII